MYKGDRGHPLQTEKIRLNDVSHFEYWPIFRYVMMIWVISATIQTVIGSNLRTKRWTLNLMLTVQAYEFSQKTLWNGPLFMFIFEIQF